MRSPRPDVLLLTFIAMSIIAVAEPAWADRWNVEKAGFNLYRIAGQNVFIRTERCDDAPAKGVVTIQKEGDARWLSFDDSAARCTVKDFLAPVDLEWNEHGVLLTRDQGNNWYRVTDSDLYLKTAGCISRAISESAVLDLSRGGSGWLRFADGRRCAVEHAFKRFNP